MKLRSCIASMWRKCLTGRTCRSRPNYVSVSLSTFFLCERCSVYLFCRIRGTLLDLRDRSKQAESSLQSDDALFDQEHLLRDIQQLITKLEAVKDHINRSVTVTGRDPLRGMDEDSPLDEMRGRPDLHQSSQASDPTRIVKNLWDVESNTSPADSPATTPTAASFHLSNSISHVQPRVKRRVDNIPGGHSGCMVIDI